MGAMDLKTGFIGGGNMAEAFTGALISSDIYNSSQIYISDVSADRLDVMAKTYGVSAVNDNFDVFMKCDIVILAVKPQVMDDVLSEIARHPDYSINSRKLIISIAAGITIQTIEDILYRPLAGSTHENLPIVRVMPNTPALVLSGMSGMSPNQYADKEDLGKTRTILEGIGKVAEFKEEELDAVTALSGSGPAYVFYLAESMIDAGIKIGLNPEEACLLSMETLKGAVKLMDKSDETPEELRRRVTSPGGTTEAAFKVLDGSRVKGNIIDAITAAAARSKELSG